MKDLLRWVKGFPKIAAEPYHESVLGGERSQKAGSFMLKVFIKLQARPCYALQPASRAMEQNALDQGDAGVGLRW